MVAEAMATPTGIPSLDTRSQEQSTDGLFDEIYSVGNGDLISNGAAKTSFKRSVKADMHNSLIIAVESRVRRLTARDTI